MTSLIEIMTSMIQTMTSLRQMARHRVASVTVVVSGSLSDYDVTDSDHDVTDTDYDVTHTGG